MNTRKTHSLLYAGKYGIIKTDKNVYNGHIQYTNKSMILSVDDEKSGDVTYQVSGGRCTIKCEGV
ncbi:MAG: hypothetical protein II296_08070, partial [Bacteroidaceae bacterium]|nr:hypothetical protein [Bacteroidaceae bacterium]